MVDWREVATVWQLCHVLAAQRQRPIHLESRALPPPLAGLWLASVSVDYIFYAEHAPPLLQAHTVLHEVAHILLGLRETLLLPVDPCEEQTMLAPLTFERALVARTRSCYEDQQECMAELLATLIEQRWHAARHPDLGPPPCAHLYPDIRWLAEYFSIEP